MHRHQLIVIVALAMAWWGQARGQACCSGGVPISANLGLPPQAGQTLQLNFAYDLNVLETLKEGRTVIEDHSRRRQTHSALLQAGYSFSERWAVDALFSWVRQERLIEQFGREDFTATNGIGDAVFLMKYQLYTAHQSQSMVWVGAGAKAPLGAADLSRDDGLTINADLQPGSGAWDGIGWMQLIHALPTRPSLALSATSVYSLKGVNDAYLGSEAYQFGAEWQWSAGLSDRVLLGKSIVDPALTIRYRRAWPDRFNRQVVPNTGGSWIFLAPAFNFWTSPDVALNARIELPLLASLTGTQVSPTYRLQLGLFVRLALRSPQLPGLIEGS